jgi:hypothetical protein
MEMNRMTGTTETTKTVTWKTLIMETAKTKFGTKEFKRIDLVNALKDEAQKHYPENKNVGTTVGNNLSKLQKAGLVINVRKGFWKLAA